MQGIRRALILATTLAVVAAACGNSTTPNSAGSSTVTFGSLPGTPETTASPTTSGATSSTGLPASTTVVTRVLNEMCAPTDGAIPLANDLTVDLARIHDDDGITIDAAQYPHPDYSGNPWSQWGQGIVSASGRYYSAIGDHLGADGNSFVYEYDPSTNQLTMIADVLASSDHNPGAWGFGKVHAQMALGPCDEVFFATYWGTRRGLTYENGYTGDLLFHIDPHTRTLVNHGVPLTETGIPTMAAAPEHGLLYAVAVEPETDEGTFLVIETASADVIFSAPAAGGFRSIAVDGAGAAWYSSAAGELTRYDPASGTTDSTISAPGTFLRAADTREDGTVVGVMRRPDTLFVLADGGIESFEEADGYTTSVGLSSDGSEFFYLPGAHGNASANGAILFAVDAETGEQREVIALADIVNSSLGVTLGGTYNLVVDENANRIYLGVNVDPSGAGQGFGEVVLLVIDLP